MTTKIKVYLCARISKDAHKWNNYICNSLNPPIRVFMPQKHNPWNMPHKEFPKEVYETDLGAMKESHMALLLPEYGRDCAYEIGWYANSEKPIIVFVDDQLEWLRDWMVKGGIDYIITNNAKSFTLLKKDPILKNKPIKYINNIVQLNNEIVKICKKHYKKC